MLAVGFRHSTWVSRPAGAASRLVGLHTPPSTYSRPSIVTGANSHGTVQDAATASATVAFGAPGLPNTTRRPLRRSTAATRSRPSNRGSSRSTLRRRSLERLLGRGQPAQEQRPRQRSAGRGEAERERRERGADGERPLAGAAGGGQAGGGQAIRGPGGVRQLLEVRADRRRPPRRMAGDQMGGDDRAGRRTDVVVAVAQVEAGAVLDPGQDAHHPGLAEDPTAAEDEHVGS